MDNPSDDEDNMVSTNDLNERLDSSILQLEKQISSLMEAQSEIKKGLEELKTGSPNESWAKYIKPKAVFQKIISKPLNTKLPSNLSCI